MWLGSPLHYREAMAEMRGNDWEVRYSGSRFAWIGNGFSHTEFDPTSDLAYYIRDEDDSPYTSRGKRRDMEWESAGEGFAYDTV